VPAAELLEEYSNDKEYECEEVVSGVSTRKSAIFNAKGDTIFLIVGIGQHPKQYYLWSRFVIEEILIDEEGDFLYHAFGQGWLLAPPKYLNSSSFNEFKSYCGNFGFGLIPINGSPYLKTLKHFSELNKPRRPKINFRKYVDEFYKQVIRINPSEEERLFE